MHAVIIAAKHTQDTLFWGLANHSKEAVWIENGEARRVCYGQGICPPERALYRQVPVMVTEGGNTVHRFAVYSSNDRWSDSAKIHSEALKAIDRIPLPGMITCADAFSQNEIWKRLRQGCDGSDKPTSAVIVGNLFEEIQFLTQMTQDFADEGYQCQIGAPKIHCAELDQKPQDLEAIIREAKMKQGAIRLTFLSPADTIADHTLLTAYALENYPEAQIAHDNQSLTQLANYLATLC